MADTVTRSQTISSFDTWTGEVRDLHGRSVSGPRLRVLFHTDLDRIGAVSVPLEALHSGAWLELGRYVPEFVDPRAAGREAPLDDPTISRTQLRLRWLSTEQCFEVESVSAARRGVSVVRFEPGESSGKVVLEPLAGRARLTPGACVAIEDRVLLALEVTRYPFVDASVDRLGLLGESEVMWQLRHDIMEVAEFRHPALLLGPTGAGKELVAHAIHAQSARRKEAFVTVNCAALPEQLVESLLFGHKKGAFTGADAAAPGRFGAAHRGTLFLDELGEMPIGVQPKLLRAVQEGRIVPVGEHTPLSVDVRLIAATNRDPWAEIKAGRLREDLYHRLSSHLLYLPPLEARRFDVPELFMHFLRGLRTEHPRLEWLWESGRQWRRSIPMSFVLDLLGRPWPGNVRELQNVVVRTARRNLNPGSFQVPLDDGPRSSMEHVITQTPGEPVIEPASEEPGVDGHDADLLRRASELLELAHKTVAKLVPPEELAAVFDELGDGPTAILQVRLSAIASERLVSLLEHHAFRQRAVAGDLDVSPSTLIKLMAQFSIPRPSDLSLEVIEAAIEAAGGDVDAAARVLKVSPQGLRKQVTLLRLKGG